MFSDDVTQPINHEEGSTPRVDWTPNLYLKVRSVACIHC